MTTRTSDSIQDRRQKPWAMVEIELLRDPRITPQCKALYGLLITYGPQSIFPGQDTLAECLGTTRQTVKRWLDDLKLQGLIDWENRTGTSNKYYILGHANFKGDVTPTLQGCNTSVTGDVTPTLHDLDPLILNQELEKTPPLADSPPVTLQLVPDDTLELVPLATGETAGQTVNVPGAFEYVFPDDDADETAAMFKEPPPREPRTAEDHKAAIRHALEEHANNGDRAGVADPTHEGDPWAAVLDEFYLRFKPGLSDASSVKGKKRKNQIAKLRALTQETLADKGLSTKEMIARACAVIHPLSLTEKWWIKTTTTPFQDGWAEGFTTMLIVNPTVVEAQARDAQRNGNSSTHPVQGDDRVSNAIDTMFDETGRRRKEFRRG